MARQRIQAPTATAETPTTPAGDAVERAIAEKQAAALASTRAKLAETDPEREAIQEEAAGKLDLPKAVGEMQGALGAAFFGKGPSVMPKEPGTGEMFSNIDKIATTPAAVSNASTGDTFTVTIGEEMYGKTGTFSSYRVGPFTAQGRVREGETLSGAMKRVLAELAAVAAAERLRADAEFKSHFKNTFAPAA